MGSWSMILPRKPKGNPMSNREFLESPLTDPLKDPQTAPHLNLCFRNLISCSSSQNLMQKQIPQEISLQSGPVISYKWDYTPYKWAKSMDSWGLIAVITPVMTGRGHLVTSSGSQISWWACRGYRVMVLKFRAQFFCLGSLKWAFFSTFTLT